MYIYIYICTCIHIYIYIYTYRHITTITTKQTNQRLYGRLLELMRRADAEKWRRMRQKSKKVQHLYMYVCMYVCMYIYIYIYI